jgi:hypothetical protein
LIFGYFGPISAVSGRRESARRRHSGRRRNAIRICVGQCGSIPEQAFAFSGFFPAFRITLVHRQAEF